jgi:hypothetical protein
VLNRNNFREMEGPTVKNILELKSVLIELIRTDEGPILRQENMTRPEKSGEILLTVINSEVKMWKTKDARRIVGKTS